MLDEKDLQAIAGLINDRATRTENLILDELSRTRSILEDQFSTEK